MNISMSEILVILLIALLVIKPDQLPEMAHALGRFFQSIKQLLQKMKHEISGYLNSVDKQ